MALLNNSDSATEELIRLDRISKRYQLFAHPRHRLQRWLTFGHYGACQDHWALQDASFSIRRGEAIGLIGLNGSGKSTLLQIISGTLRPTQGELSINCRIAALLELGSGFNPEFSGLDNLFLNGQILGVSNTKIKARLDDILAFADIGDAIHQPLKTYSSGMAVRLAFAMVAHLDPELLIVDEALSVGDVYFQQKCAKHIRGLLDRGVSLLFVSHDMGSVRNLCERVMVLEEGRLVFDGEKMAGIKRYLSRSAMPGIAPALTHGPLNTQSLSAPPGFPPMLDAAVWWHCGGEIDQAPPGLVLLAAFDDQGHPAQAFRLGTWGQFIAVVKTPADMVPTFTLQIKDRYDNLVSALNTRLHQMRVGVDSNARTVWWSLRVKFDLEGGDYTFRAIASIVPPTDDSLSCTTGTPENGPLLPAHTIGDSGWLGPLRVAWDYGRETPPFNGMFGLAHQFEMVSQPQANCGQASAELIA